MCSGVSSVPTPGEDGKKIYSDAKISLFYKSVRWFFLVVLLASCIFGIYNETWLTGIDLAKRSGFSIMALWVTRGHRHDQAGPGATCSSTPACFCR